MVDLNAMVLLFFTLLGTITCLQTPSLTKIKTANLLEKYSPQPEKIPSIVLITGFEAFNIALYRKAANEVMKKVNNEVHISVFTDVDINEHPEKVENALSDADVLFASLIFDYNQINWIKSRIENIPTKFCFESALELMSETKVGEFQMKSNNEEMAGPPAPIKAILSQFGSSKEEDKMTGYLKFLKIGPKFLNLIPSDKFKDLKTWLTVYSYWNEGGFDNVVSMLYLILKDFQLIKSPALLIEPDIVKETPLSAFYHPDLNKFISSPREYVEWFEKTHPWVNEKTARVGILFYRKHVITGQEYIANVIKLMQNEGIMPIPVFINGVEAHTVVRDLFSTPYEQRNVIKSASSQDIAMVDCIVNTIGFPLVGGPAGSMEGGRQIDVAREILTSKNVPYIVSAPLLIQDIDSWKQSGVQGLQTVVLYALPELDGAIETIVLGGLIDGERITVIPERVRKLVRRLNAWVHLQKTKPAERRIAIMTYGFPPNTGAVGTAALLNVDKSLRNTLTQLAAAGYNIGPIDPSKLKDDAIVSALRSLYQEGVSGKGVARAASLVEGLDNLPGVKVVGREIPYTELRSWLGKEMTAKIVKQWGDLESYQGIGTVGSGKLGVIGLQFGNIFIGMQPLLGIEGDPMRLLFDRDLCPHPQYAAFYSWLNNDYNPDAIIHFGMHGTVEWLPGSPLGSTAESWPDVLLGDKPNLYVYAANNPSESILAKRRGYSTLVSHNVPPYSRAGLYKDLTNIKELTSEYRTDRSQSAISLIAAILERTELYQDTPFRPSASFQDQVPVPVASKIYSADGVLTAAHAEELLNSDQSELFVLAFNDYVGRLWEYLLELENRIFSEGLHEIGGPLTARNIFGYLQAVFAAGESKEKSTQLSDFVLHSIADSAVKRLPSKRIISKASQANALASVRYDGVSKSKKYTFEEVDGLESAFLRENHWEAAPISDGLHLSDLFDSDAKLQLRLLKTKGLSAGLRFSYLRFKSDWGDADADEEIAALKAVGEKGIDHNGRLISEVDPDILTAAIKLAQKLVEYSNEEMTSLLKGLNGEYIPAAPGGDLIRDGVGVLPTGRNIHALDPYRIPSSIALERGKKIAEQLIQEYKAQHNTYPETIAVTLWGLDSIKTKGESIGILLGLVGAEPVREGTGRIVGFDMIPLNTLGRPRVDVIGSLSGIFRDTFGNVLDLLDDLFEKLATADEPREMNFIKKHSDTLASTGVERPYSRLFANPPGDFGSMVNERVGSGDWKTSEELGDTWESRNSFSYGRRGERGVDRRQVLKSLLNSTDSIVQEIDSVEYGLTDIQEYYANTGALKRAAENNRQGKVAVGLNVVETFDKKARARDLNETLRLEYRSKLLNPKWADSMLAQGSGGGFEISQRMTAMIGWAGTTGFSEKWVYDGTAQTYVFDEKRAEKLRKNNPEAFRNMIRRMLEADGRGFWTPDESVREKLKELYSEVEDEIEGVSY